MRRYIDMNLFMTALIALSGGIVTYAGDSQMQKSRSDRHFEVKKIGNGMEKVTTNGSPTPPEGYERPVAEDMEKLTGRKPGSSIAGESKIDENGKKGGDTK